MNEVREQKRLGFKTLADKVDRASHGNFRIWDDGFDLVRLVFEDLLRLVFSFLSSAVASIGHWKVASRSHVFDSRKCGKDCKDRAASTSAPAWNNLLIRKTRNQTNLRSLLFVSFVNVGTRSEGATVTST
jgi:hypothetical protein